MSGIAIDTFLFSRIGTPLFHRYRVFDRLGSHPAFRKPYMPKLLTFLRESDSESIRRNKNAATETTLTRPAAQRTVVSKITARDTGRSLIPTASGQPW